MSGAAEASAKPKAGDLSLAAGGDWPDAGAAGRGDEPACYPGSAGGGAKLSHVGLANALKA